MSATKIEAALNRQRGRDGLRLPATDIPALAKQIHLRFHSEVGAAAALLSIDMQKLVTRAEVEATLELIAEANSRRREKPYWRGDGWDPAWVRRDPRWFGRPDHWYVPVGKGLWLNSPWPGLGPLRFSGDADRVTRISLAMRSTPEGFAATLRKFRSEVQVAGLIIWPDSRSDATALAQDCKEPLETVQEKHGRKVTLAITAAVSGHVREPPEHHFTLTAVPDVTQQAA